MTSDQRNKFRLLLQAIEGWRQELKMSIDLENDMSIRIYAQHLKKATDTLETYVREELK